MNDETREPKADFHGLRVAAFESRRAVEMTRLLEASGAVAFVSPTMREVPLEGSPAVIDFATRLIAGEFDVVIFNTSVGFRLALRALEGHVAQDDYVTALAKCVTVARGPKPVAAMKDVDLTPDIRIGEPNTWREILEGVRQGVVPISGKRVAIQEYGRANPDLVAGLQEMGASVVSVPVYAWELPEDIEPLRANIRRIVAGEIDVALFCSGRQGVNMLDTARDMGLDAELRDAMQRVVIASIGPMTSETLVECGLHVDIEPPHPRLGHLVAEAARLAAGIRAV